MTSIREDSLRGVAASIGRWWNRFFHQPCDARTCAAVRIMFAALVLTYYAVLYRDLDWWFTSDGVLPVGASREVINRHAWSLLWLFPDTSAAVHICYWILIVHAALLLVGLLPRVNAFFVFLWLVSFQTRNTLITDQEDSVFKLIAFCLIWIPSGQCWSMNSALRCVWRRSRSSGLVLPDKYAVPGWGLRQLQVVMALILLSAGLSKLDGEMWVDGTALYYVARLDDYFGRFPMPTWLFDTPWLVALLTWFVPLVEVTAPLLLWFRETRRLALVAVLLFHIGNEWTMHLFLFHWIMICGWLSFVEGDDFRWLRFSRAPRDAETVAA